MNEKDAAMYSEFTFEEAKKYFKDKLVLTKEEYESLEEEYKSRAFTIGNYTSTQVLNKFYTEVLKAIEDGTTMTVFRDNMNEFLEKKGMKGISNFQVDNIFRTNIQTAYNAGHYASMNSPTVKQMRPYWMYTAVNDSKTRPSHRAMDGLVFRSDDPIWDTWYPPNGFRCRCSVVTLSKRQLESMGLKVQEGKPPNGITPQGELVPIMPDKNFNTNAAIQKFEPDVSDYPKAFQKAFKRINKQDA